MSNIGEKLKHEINELIPVTLFFLVAFELLALTQALMLEQYGISVMAFAAAAVGALIVAKVVLIADHLKFVDRYPDKPLIYNVIWKTVIYFVASIVVRYAEHLIHFWRQTGDFAEANRRIFEDVVWSHVIVVQIWLAILLLVYCALRELMRALGRDKILAMFFKYPLKTSKTVQAD